MTHRLDRRRCLQLSLAAAMNFRLDLGTPALSAGRNEIDVEAVDPSFVVFDGLLQFDKPNLARLGMPSMRGTGNLWRPGLSKDEVDYVGTRDAVRFIRNFGTNFYLDIERWPILGVPEREADWNLAKLIEVAEIARRIAPFANFGIYGVMPQIAYWPIVLPEEESLARWRRSNIRVSPLRHHVDYVFPSLYTFYEDRAGWEKYAAEMLKEARRYERPAYAFIWPQFHDSNIELRGTYLSGEYWRMQLEFCRRHADGVVIWGGYGDRWDERAGWWLETKSFLRSL